MKLQGEPQKLACLRSSDLEIVGPGPNAEADFRDGGRTSRNSAPRGDSTSSTAANKVSVSPQTPLKDKDTATMIIASH